MYTNEELLDSIITEMYEMFKALVTGNYTVFCAAFADIMSKLKSLREGLKEDEKATSQRIKDLKDQLKRATAIEPEPGGSVVGGETTEINYDPRREE